MSAFSLSGGSAGRSRFLGGTCFSRDFLRVALLTAASLAATAPAHAAVFWFDEDPMRPRAIMTPERAPQPQPRRDNRLKQQGTQLEKQAKEHAKPVGPLVIAISITNQTMRVFDANGLFAESKISSGMRGHETPMGVFSIIQKNKWHKSNIYSGAPMPYMQRVTWSGIALHAGALPGYPASHGCIRMPMAFATKLWGWTRMGARVIITPGEISPAEFSHPVLVAQKPAAPKSEPEAAKPGDGKSTEVKPGDLGLKPGTDIGRVRTANADASNAVTAAAKPVLSDAATVVAEMSSAAADIAKSAGKTTDDTARVSRQDVDAAAAKAIEPPAPEAKTPETPVAATAPEAKKDDSRPAEAAKVETRPEVKPETKAETAKVDPVDLPPPPDTAPKRTGQIAVLISGKDGKLYVRQNFSPLFETPITIKPGDRPLGTHVFTARIDKDEAKSIRWTAVSLPAVPHRAADAGRRKTNTVEVSPPPLSGSAAEALDRVVIPEDAMAQITEALATGGSIIVSDQSIKAGGETGQGTEFVVPLR